MPDVLLIQPPIEDFYLTAKRTLPYGLACIAAVLRKNGFSVDIIDALATPKTRAREHPAEMTFLAPYFGRADQSPFGLFHQYRHFGFSYQHIARLAKGSGAALIGISSLFTAYSPSALETAAAVKKACPNAVVVLGGHHPTALPEDVLQHRAVDFVLRGDGEVGMPMLAKAIIRGGSLEAIPGLVQRNPNGELRKTPPAVVEDLSQMPIPAFDLIDWRHYQRKGGASLSLAAGRGCPLRCTYCAVNTATYHGFRQKPVAAVMAELEAAHAQMPLGFIDFEDEHLSADREWFMALLKAIEDRFGQHKPELRAMNGLYAPSLDHTLVKQMARSGFKTLNLALITTDPSQLKRFGRPDVSREIDRTLALAARFGLNSVAYIMVAGPHQDPRTAVKDLLFLARRPVLAGVSVFYPAPGSADYQWCRKHRLLPSRASLMAATALPLVHATDRTQTVTLLRLGRILNFIKKILDQGRTLPHPRKIDRSVAGEIQDRDELGRHLLASFFNDGTLYGRENDGTIYSHLVDPALTREFLNGLQNISISGTKP